MIASEFGSSHRNQLRKGSGIPYIAHLMSVSSRVLSAGGTETQAISGLLHDAAEDQGGEPTLEEIRRRFGADVERIVYDCTDSWETPKPAWRPRKEAYLASLPSKPKTSLLVSLADKLDNAKRSSTTTEFSATSFGLGLRASATEQSGIIGP